jgi:hypothetical protein
MDRRSPGRARAKRAEDISDVYPITRIGARTAMVRLQGAGVLELEDRNFRLMAGIRVHRYYLASTPTHCATPHTGSTCSPTAPSKPTAAPRSCRYRGDRRDEPRPSGSCARRVPPAQIPAPRPATQGRDAPARRGRHRPMDLPRIARLAGSRRRSRGRQARGRAAPARPDGKSERAGAAVGLNGVELEPQVRLITYGAAGAGRSRSHPSSSVATRRTRPRRAATARAAHARPERRTRAWRSCGGRWWRGRS